MDPAEKQGEGNAEPSEAAPVPAPAPVIVGPGKAIPRFAIVLANSKGKEVVRRYHTLTDAQDTVLSQKAHDAYLALDNLQQGTRDGGQDWLSAHAVDVPIRFRVLQQPSRVRDNINMLKTSDSENLFDNKIDGGENILDAEKVQFRMIMLKSIQHCEYTFWPIKSDGHWVPVILQMRETIQGSLNFDRVACIFVADPDGDSSRQLAVMRRMVALLGACGFPAERFSLPVYAWTPQQMGDCNCGLQCYVIFDEFMRRMTRQFLSNQEMDPYEPIRRHFDAQSVREEMAGLCAAMCVRELGDEARIAVEVVGEVAPPDTIQEQEVRLEDLEKEKSVAKNIKPKNPFTYNNEPSDLMIEVIGPEDFANRDMDSNEDDDRLSLVDSGDSDTQDLGPEGNDSEESIDLAHSMDVFSSKSDDPPRQPDAGTPRAVNTDNIPHTITIRISIIDSKLAGPPIAEPYNTEPLRAKRCRSPDPSYSYLKYAIFNSMRYMQQNSQMSNTQPPSAVPSRVVSAMARLVMDGLAMAEPAIVEPAKAGAKKVALAKAEPKTAVPGRYVAFTPFRYIPSNVGSASECSRLAVHNSTYLYMRKAQQSNAQQPNDRQSDARYWFDQPWWIWTSDVGDSQSSNVAPSRAATTGAAAISVPAASFSMTGAAAARAAMARVAKRRATKTRVGPSNLGRFNTSLSNDEISDFCDKIDGAAVDTARSGPENMLAIGNGLKRKGDDSTARTQGKRPKVTSSDLSPEADGNILQHETP